MTTRPLTQQQPVPLAGLFLVFLRMGLTSFGGGLAAWMHREMVERRHWLSEETFLAGFTLARILPGGSAVNLAIHIGLRLRGSVGAALAMTAVLGPPFFTIIGIGALYSRFGGSPVVHVVLGGLAAAGVGMTLSVGIKVARQLGRSLIQAIVAATVFVAVGVLHWPMVPVVVVIAPLSVALAVMGRERPT